MPIRCLIKIHVLVWYYRFAFYFDSKYLMAKSRNPVLKHSGTIGNITFVDSKTYGAHSRLPRGTYKKTEINKILKSNTQKPKTSGFIASQVLKVFKSIAGSFAESQLWQIMQSRILKLSDITIGSILGSLKELELNSAYPLESVISPLPTVDIIKKKKQFIIELRNQSHVYFDKKIKADSYYYEIFLTWFNEKGMVITTEQMQTEWILQGKNLNTYAMIFEKPEDAKHFILVLKAAAGSQGKEIERMSATGMKVMGGR